MSHIRARFSPVAFEHRSFARQPAATRWSRSSPLHLDRHSLARLFPPDFFDASFTIMRHLVDRLVGAFRFQQEAEQTTPATTGFSEWLDNITDLREETPLVDDYHIRPMDDAVPLRATVHWLETGRAPVTAWFDTLLGSCGGVAPPTLTTAPKTARDTGGTEVTAYDRDVIARLYAADFARFGYTPEEAAEANRETPAADGRRRLWTRK